MLEEPQTPWQKFVGPDYLVADHSFLARTAIFFGRAMLQGIEAAVLCDGAFHRITIPGLSSWQTRRRPSSRQKAGYFRAEEDLGLLDRHAGAS